MFVKISLPNDFLLMSASRSLSFLIPFISPSYPISSVFLFSFLPFFVFSHSGTPFSGYPPPFSAVFLSYHSLSLFSNLSVSSQWVICLPRWLLHFFFLSLSFFFHCLSLVSFCNSLYSSFSLPSFSLSLSPSHPHTHLPSLPLSLPLQRSVYFLAIRNTDRSSTIYC